MRTMQRAVAGLTTFVVAASLLGCGDAAPGPTGLTPSQSPRLDVSANRATTVTTNEQIPITLFVFVACANGGAGEVIEVSGDLHVLSHVTISSSGNFHAKFHNQPMGISGVGLVTGDKYQATGVTQEQFNDNQLPFNDTYINNFRMIGQGPGNNFMVHQTIHFTVNANGEVTSVVDNTKVSCK